MVEAPGTAPGSDGFITLPVYRHIRLAPAPVNIGDRGLDWKGRCAGGERVIEIGVHASESG